MPDSSNARRYFTPVCRFEEKLKQLKHCTTKLRCNQHCNNQEAMSTSAGDVEVVVATSAPARKLSKKMSFTGMPYDDVFCLNKEQAVKLLSHGGLNAKDIPRPR